MSDSNATGTRQPSPQNRLAVFQAVVLATFSVLPGFLIGALAVSMRADLEFGPSALGVAVAWFFLTTALGAAQLGRLVERLGIRASLTVGGLASATSMLGVAAAPSYPWVLAALTIGGLANAVSQPAVNAALSVRISAERLGLAIGIKQSSIPASTLLGGLAVPTLGATVGWRWTFVAAALLAATSGVTAWTLGSRGPGRVQSRGSRAKLREAVPDLRSLVILAVGGSLAAAAATSLGAFLVDGAVSVGLTESRAGILFAIASSLGLGSRVLIGWLADRHADRSRYGAIIALLALGAPGYALLAVDAGTAYLAGSLIAYGAGWAWPGLFHFAVISQHPKAPAAATGVIQTGIALGAGVGPLVLGVVAERYSYQAVWLVAGALSLGGALFFLIGRSHLRRALSRDARPVMSPEQPTLPAWGTTRAKNLGRGVQEQTIEYQDSIVTLFRLGPGSQLKARCLIGDRYVTLIEGRDVEFRVGSVSMHPEAGRGVSLPVGLIWSAENCSSESVTVARYHSDEGQSRLAAD
jgi:predicted MFS family arabinose efflux permease